MKTVFISTPVEGRTEQEVTAERKAAAQLVMEKYGPFNLLDTFVPCSEFSSPIEHLAERIKRLQAAEVAVFPRDWWHYRECRLEHAVCVAYHIPVIEV